MGHLIAHGETAEQIAAQGGAEWRNPDATFLGAMDISEAFDHGSTGSVRLAKRAEAHCHSRLDAKEVCHVRWSHGQNQSLVGVCPPTSRMAMH